jgi:hypothetical protein
MDVLRRGLVAHLASPRAQETGCKALAYVIARHDANLILAVLSPPAPRHDNGADVQKEHDNNDDNDGGGRGCFSLDIGDRSGISLVSGCQLGAPPPITDRVVCGWGEDEHHRARSTGSPSRADGATVPYIGGAYVKAINPEDLKQTSTSAPLTLNTKPLTIVHEPYTLDLKP